MYRELFTNSCDPSRADTAYSKVLKWINSNFHRVSIEGKSPYKESYIYNSHWKMFGDVIKSKVA